MEPSEALFLMFFLSHGRLVGTVTWAGNKEHHTDPAKT
uniref:Uncharacterized protein n=1 Tax=Moniliophthora roreri TaxID=221103 RepID=A0A0W0FTW3_MONRR